MSRMTARPGVEQISEFARFAEELAELSGKTILIRLMAGLDADYPLGLSKVTRAR